MIVEHALITVSTGREEEFAAVFPRWRAVIGQFLAEPPVVEHVVAVTAGVTTAA